MSAEDRSGRACVLACFGRYFAPKADLLTREGFKTLRPIEGSSPFTAAGDPDPQMAPHSDDERANERVRLEVAKDLAARLRRTGADYLLVDTSAAALWHREVDGRLYAIVDEATDLMDALWHHEADPRAVSVKLTANLTDTQTAAFDAFTAACREAFDPSRIILIRSRAARFWLDADGAVHPADGPPAITLLLDELDRRFATQTGCRVVDASLACTSPSRAWHGSDHRLRMAVEQQVVDVIDGAPDEPPVPTTWPAPGAVDVAGLVIDAVRRGEDVDAAALRRSFATTSATYDDLLALAYLQQARRGHEDGLVTECVQLAIADGRSLPVAHTQERFARSLTALRDWRGCSVALPTHDPWVRQATVHGDGTLLRFLLDGTITRVRAGEVRGSDVDVILAGDRTLGPLDVAAAISSWPLYLERGRRGVTAPLECVVPAPEALVDSCACVDWAWVLRNEQVVIRRDDSWQRESDPALEARTDLSFIFDPATRICTVSGGLMDQVTHIALFDQWCSGHGLDYVLDDFRYTWWPTHNGFEAARLAPELESRRMSRKVSQALVESFRCQVLTTRLPWVFSQSRTWHEFGLREATVVTRDYFNARDLLKRDPAFPVRVYESEDDLGALLRNPPKPLSFFTTQHRVPISPESAEPLQKVFSYAPLLAAEAPARVTQTAELLRAAPHVALHVRRGDYLDAHFDTDGWHSAQEHYIQAIDHVIQTELGRSDFDVAIFSDDLDFVARHRDDYGLDRVTGTVRFIEGNQHFDSIYDSYLMALCPVIVGSVGHFAATTSLLAPSPSTYLIARPGGVRVGWRR